MPASTKFSAVHITEEVFNSVTHGLGALAAIVGLVLGLVFLRMSASFAAGFVVYCVCLLVLMTMSCLYHALSFTRAKRVFRVLDHSGIFLLIAGSFTPLTIRLYHRWQEAALLVAFWALAATGITLKAALPQLMARLSVGVYIAMGWLALIFLPKLHDIPGQTIWLIIGGGILYTVGAILLAFKRPFTHTAWHVFVIAAACTHFLAISMLAA